jgi:hypothetical protein
VHSTQIYLHLGYLTKNGKIRALPLKIGGGFFSLQIAVM